MLTSALAAVTDLSVLTQSLGDRAGALEPSGIDALTVSHGLRRAINIHLNVWQKIMFVAAVAAAIYTFVKFNKKM
ncbi:hypothetical protein [Corynebacterium bovis]|uniref:hypothetical protein n=1 Tax=Corynebacterium bovis TaxID=36808 RepID=UPI000F650F91|nr:hypothetical protein [Corynebacterium bovis]